MRVPEAPPELDLSFLPEGFPLLYADRISWQNLTIVIAAPSYANPNWGRDISRAKIFFIGEDSVPQEQTLKEAWLERDGGTKTFKIEGHKIVLKARGGPKTLDGVEMEALD